MGNMLGLGHKGNLWGGEKSLKNAYKNKQTKINDADYYYYYSKYHLRNARWSVKKFRISCVKML